MHSNWTARPRKVHDWNGCSRRTFTQAIPRAVSVSSNRGLDVSLTDAVVHWQRYMIILGFSPGAERGTWMSAMCFHFAGGWCAFGYVIYTVGRHTAGSFGRGSSVWNPLLSGFILLLKKKVTQFRWIVCSRLDRLPPLFFSSFFLFFSFFSSFFLSFFQFFLLFFSFFLFSLGKGAGGVGGLNPMKWKVEPILHTSD